MKHFDRITPEGTKDYLFEDCQLRRRAEDTVRGLIEKYSYTEVMTPSLEFYDVFASGSGHIGQEEMYTLTDASGRLLVMRPDSTKPIARLYSARLQQLALPLRLYYNQSVYKRNIHFYRKSDEVRQIGAELIGAGGFRADMEMITLSAKSMKRLFNQDFVIELGHADFFKAVLSSLNLSAQEEDEVRRALVGKNYPELDRLLDGQDESRRALRDLPQLFGRCDVLERAYKFCPGAKSALDELAVILDVLVSLGLEENVRIDLAVVNDYEYYTGIVFKGFVGEMGKEILSGGRYDKLYGDYDLNIPAVGFAVNVDAAAEVLKARQRPHPTDRHIVVFSERGGEAVALSFMNDLSSRENGLNCEFSIFESLQVTQEYCRKSGAYELYQVKASGEIEKIQL